MDEKELEQLYDELFEKYLVNYNIKKDFQTLDSEIQRLVKNAFMVGCVSALYHFKKFFGVGIENLSKGKEIFELNGVRP